MLINTMIRTALILVASISSITASAQKVFFGPTGKAGISQVLFNKTDTVNDHSISNKLSFSFQAGAYAEYKFARRFSAGLELLYWWQNGKVEDDFSYVDPFSGNPVNEVNLYKSHVSYVSVPVFVQYYLSDVILMLGGHSGFEVSKSGSLQITTTSNGVTEEQEPRDYDLKLEEYDIGITAGVLYRISEKLTAGLEYYNGRVNLTQDNQIPYAARNQYFYGSFRYNLIRGKRGEIYYN